MTNTFMDFEDLETAIPENSTPQPVSQVPTPLQLKLINKKIPIKFCEYKISNTSEKMLSTETISVSPMGVLFNSPTTFPVGALMRIWMEMPDYWPRKSRLVGYRHTDAPTFFQVLTRVVSCEETNKRNMKFQLLCQTLNMDAVDEQVLNEYLGVRAS